MKEKKSKNLKLFNQIFRKKLVFQSSNYSNKMANIDITIANCDHFINCLEQHLLRNQHLLDDVDVRIELKNFIRIMCTNARFRWQIFVPDHNLPHEYPSSEASDASSAARSSSVKSHGEASVASTDSDADIVIPPVPQAQPVPAAAPDSTPRTEIEIFITYFIDTLKVLFDRDTATAEGISMRDDPEQLTEWQTFVEGILFPVCAIIRIYQRTYSAWCVNPPPAAAGPPAAPFENIQDE